MADKKQAAFVGAVVLVAAAGIYSFISDLVISFKENKPSLVETQDLKEQGEVFDVFRTEFEKNGVKDTPGISDKSGNILDADPDTIGYVISVADANTIYIDIEDIDGDEEEGTRVRIIGTAAADTVPTDNSGEVSVKDMVRKILKKGDLVYIEYDEKAKDEFGNTLAYIYLSDGTMLEEWLLSSGYANVADDVKNNKHTELFRELEDKARKEKTGMWG